MQGSLRTEPIGSIPRLPELLRAIEQDGADSPALDSLYEAAVKDTLRRFEATGSPVVTDGEQRKYQNFWTYCIHGMRNTAPDGFAIPFTDGLRRRMPRLTAGPFRYLHFTGGRFAMKVDPTGQLLTRFIDLNNLALSRFSDEERTRIAVHTCPGGDLHSTHSADVDYAELLPSLFELKAGNFCVALAIEADRVRVLKIIRQYLKAGQRVFVGVVSPIDPHIETAEEVRDRVIEAARYIPSERLGTTDDCGFAPFSDDTTTTRDAAFAKIQARVEGTAMASRILSGS